MAFEEFKGKLDEPAGVGFVPFTGQLDEPLKKPIQSEPILSPEDLMMGSIGAPNTEPTAPKQRGSSFGDEFVKGVKGAVEYALPSMGRQLGLQGSASAMVGSKKSLDLMDKIDSGAYPTLAALKDDPLYEEMRKSGQNLSVVNSYYGNRNAPDVAAKMRGATTKEFQAMATDTRTHLDMLNKYAKENKEKYGPSVEKFTDINWSDPRVAADFTNWLGYNMGSGAVQMAPIMLAAVVTKQPGLLAASSTMGVSEAVGSRLKFIQDQTKSLPPDQQGAAIAKYIADTGDANLITGLVSGSFDLILGPAAKAAKANLSASVGRVANIKKAVKELPKDIGGEAVTGALQETTQIAAKKYLQEQGLPVTLENIQDVINAAAAEAAGAPVGTAVNVGMAALQKPTPPVAAPRQEPAVAPAPPSGEPSFTFVPLAPEPSGRIEPTFEEAPAAVPPPAIVPPKVEAVPGMMTDEDLAQPENVTITPVTVTEPEVTPVTPPSAVTPAPLPEAPAAPVEPTLAAASLPETPTVPPAQTPKLFEPAPEQHVLAGQPIIEVPLKDIQQSKDLPQFKSGADAKGVVDRLEGKFDRRGVGAIQLWKRLDGRLEVISGRHRLDLAERSGETTIPAQINYESQGFDLDKATTLDSELNIRDGQGKVKDYVNYFKESKITREEAGGKGLLARTLGKRSFGIATQGSEELIAAVRGDRIGDEAAYNITINAPNDARLQSVGLQAIMDGKSMQTATNTMQAVKAMAAERDTTTDMFGFDDSLIKEAQEMAKIAAKMQQSIAARLSAITGAAKNPAMAKAEGIDVRDPDAIKRRIDELRAQKAALENWSTSPELVAEIRAARGVAAPQLELRGETEAEIRAREATQDADRQAQEAKDRADRERDFFQLQPQVAEREEAPTMDMFGAADMAQQPARTAPAAPPITEGLFAPAAKAAEAKPIKEEAAAKEGRINFFKDALPRLAFRRLERGALKAYRDKGGKEFPTYEKYDALVAFSSNELLFEDDRGRVNVGMSEPTDIVLQFLGVAPGARGQGMATSALSDVMQAADAAGVTMYIEPASLEQAGPKTPKLVDFYKRFGFTQATPGSDKILVREPGQKAPLSKEMQQVKALLLADRDMYFTDDAQELQNAFKDKNWVQYAGRPVYTTRGRGIMARSELTDVQDLERVDTQEELDAALEQGKQIAELEADKAPAKKSDYIDTRSQGSQFHGTSKPIDKLSDDISYTSNIENFYGAGFYSTDAVDVGVGYSKKGKGSEPTLYKITEVKQPNLYDMEAPLTPEIKQAAEGIFDLLYTEENNDGTPIANLRELYDAVRQNSAGEDVSASEVNAMFEGMAGALVELGYRGYEHTGGLKTSTNPHLVKIYWFPQENVRLTEVNPSDYLKINQDKQPVETKRATAQTKPEAKAATELTTSEREAEIRKINAGIKRLALEQIKLPVDEEVREAEIDKEMSELTARLKQLQGKPKQTRPTVVEEAPVLSEKELSDMQNELVKLQQQKSVMIGDPSLVDNQIEDIEDALREAGIDPREFAIEANEAQGEDIVNDEQAPDNLPSNQRLLLMPCSDMKGPAKATAMELYKGVFFQTYKSNVQPGAFPLVVILSAKHGFINTNQEIAPYDEVMSTARADTMLANLPKYIANIKIPSGITDVMIVGGKEYQRVMRAAVAELQSFGLVSPEASINATSGGIGVQRQQLGEYLRAMQPTVPVITQEPFTIDVEARVIDENVKRLPAPDAQKLEKHYGVKRGTDDFVQMVKDDIVRFANEGAEAVAKAIREIIRKLHAGVLSAAMIFNPVNISSPEFLFHPSYTYREEKQVLAEVPEEVIPRMSPSARQAYKVLYPSIKDRLIKADKLMVIADKPAARVFVFKPDGSLLLDKKVLYGSAIGDFYKGNNDLPQNRITPAGLFTLGLRDATRSAGEARTAGEYDFKKVFVLDKAIGGEYSVTLMHSVWLNEADAKAREKALQTPEAADSRYSFGCINVDKPTYSFLINNHLQQMDGASLFVVPDDPANLAAMLAGKENVGDELNRTTFKTPTVEIKKTGQLPSAKARAAGGMAAGERRKKPSDFLFNVEEPNKRQTNTPEFKRWFSNSKVVNEDGSPKVMYHGTNKDFNEFVIAEKANRTGMPDGFYFTSDQEDASRYAKGEGANVLPVYLSIKNPYNLGGKNRISKEMVMQFRDELRADNPSLPFSWIQEKVEIFKEKTAAGRFPFPSISFPTAAMQRVFEAGGYDGLIDGSKVFVAFNSNQVKSAIGNRGTFGESANILENVTQEQSLAEEDRLFERDALRKEQIKEYASMRAALARVPKQVAAGKVDLSMQAAVTRLVQQARDLNTMIKVTKPRLDSAEQFLAKAAIEFDKGNISEDVFNVIKTAYDKMPELLGGLLLSVRAPTGSSVGRAAGQFLPFTRVVRLFKGTSGVTDPVTIRHELTHSLEQMMTPEQRAVVAQSWLKGLQAAIKKNPDEKHQKYFHAVMDFIDRPNQENFRKAQDLLPSYDMYQFINPSEFWAVNAENLMAAELGNAWGKFKRAIARLWEGLKNVFGFDNRYVVQKMFKDVMNGSKERISKEMLIDLVGSAGVQFDVLENIEDDKKLLDKYNRPNTPQIDQSPLTTQAVKAGKLGKDFFTYAVSAPLEALGTAANFVDREILYARNKNIWFGSGLNAADFSRYNGDLVTSQGLATASVALDNAIRGGQIATEVIFQGGIKFDSKSRNFVAVKRDKGMRGVYEAEGALKKRLGNQLGTDIIQGYLEAKRSRSIQNEYFDREVEYEFFKSNYEELLASGAPQEDIMAARDAMAEAKEDLQAIEVVYKKIRMSDEEIDDFIARDAVHPELRKIMDNWSAINQNMLAFWRQVGLLSEKRYENLSNIKDYVPWQRIMNDETDIHSPVQTSNRKMTNIGLEKLFKKGKPTVITDFVAKDGQQDFKIQPAAEVEVEINGSPVDPDKFTMTADGKVKLDVPVTAGDLVVFKASREIENIIDNMTRNVMRMTMNGLRQAAAQRIVLEYATRNKKGKIMVFPKADKARGRFDFIVNGKRVVVEIQDPLIAESIFGMESLDIAMLDTLAAAANFTRRTITLSGVFQIKQVFKDAPTAALVTGVKHPLLLIGGVYKGFVTSLLNTDPTVKILKAAGIGGFQSLARTPEAEIKRRLGIMNRNVFDFVIKGLDHIGDSSDMAQRVAVYKRVLAETGNETQALYQAANVINFLHHGSGQIAQGIVKTVPFAGAYANSMDVLIQALAGGGLKGRSRANALARLAMTGTLLAGITLLYCMLVGDDDEYNQMDDQTKLRNFMIPGTKILLPMNTSAAYFYKAVPEMIYNKVVKEGTKNAVDERRLRTALKEAAIDMLLGPTPVPSAVKPFIEIGLNKDFFTGRPVVPESLAKLDAAERYTAATSEAGKLLSSLTGTKEKRLLDPLEADHLIRGIFGTAGAMTQWFTNSIAVASGERVAPTDKEQPITGSFLRTDIGRRNEDLFYDFKSVVDNKYGTYAKMLEREDDKAAEAYEEKHSDIIDFYKDVNKIDSELKEINAEIRYYGESKDTGLTPDQRREEIKQLQLEKQEMLDDIIEMRKEAGL